MKITDMITPPARLHKAGNLSLAITYIFEPPHGHYQYVQMSQKYQLDNKTHSLLGSAILTSTQSRAPTGAPCTAYQFMSLSKQVHLCFLSIH